MHLRVTDRLTCPRCGPRFGLILLAHRTTGDRRVLEGELGCSNCRDRFPVRGGFGDLRAPPRRDLPEGRAPHPEAGDPDEAERLQALLAVVRGPGMVALVGEPARHARALAERIEEVEILAVDPGAAAWPEEAGITRLAGDPGLPVFDGTLRGVVVDASLPGRWVEEAARATAPRNRVVAVHAGEDTESRLADAGLRVLAAEAGTVVAARA